MLQPVLRPSPGRQEGSAGHVVPVKPVAKARCGVGRHPDPCSEIPGHGLVPFRHISGVGEADDFAQLHGAFDEVPDVF